MACKVVCISCTTGASGEEVGKLVAERLGFAYADEEVVARAAARGGIDAGSVADEESRKSRAARVLEALALTGDLGLVAGVPLRAGNDEVTWSGDPRSDPRNDRAHGCAGKRRDRRARRITRPARQIGCPACPRHRVPGCPSHEGGRVRRPRPERRGPSREGVRRGTTRLPSALLRPQGRVADAVRPRPEHGCLVERPGRPAHRIRRVERPEFSEQRTPEVIPAVAGESRAALPVVDQKARRRGAWLSTRAGGRAVSRRKALAAGRRRQLSAG